MDAEVEEVEEEMETDEQEGSLEDELVRQVTAKNGPPCVLSYGLGFCPVNAIVRIIKKYPSRINLLLVDVRLSVDDWTEKLVAKVHIDIFEVLAIKCPFQ